MLRSTALSLLMCCCLTTGALAQATRPVRIWPPESPELPAIRATAKAFLRALQDDDLAKAKKMYAGSDENFALASQIRDTDRAVRQLKAAMAKRYSGQTSEMPISRQYDLSARIEAIDSEPISLTGSLARIAGGPKLELSNGQWWIIDLVAFPSERNAMARGLPCLQEAATETTADINRGDLPTIEAATRALYIRFGEKWESRRRGLARHTSPSTRPNG